MPVVHIEIRRACPPAEERALMAAVHEALVASLQIPAHDRIVRLSVHPPERFACPANVTQPDRFTLIGIDLFAGRSLAAKRRLYAELARRLGELGIPADHLLIRLREIPREDWGANGVCAADVDPGFRIDV
ncbi:MAG: tautomerase family protein [Candidatus Dactylopiibacterium sp.]|nr:tautomerase family protein [Candidatus Dactylopiibacterium sp.]